MKTLKKFNKNQKGFTLIELLAVIVILAVIAAIAIPLISNIIGKSKEDADMATARQVYDAARLYVTNESSGDFKDKVIEITGGTDSLQVKGYLETNIALPSTKATIASGTVTFGPTGTLTNVVLRISDNEQWTFNGSDVIAGKGKGNKTDPTP
jgi:type IV pilus assembly protein PilA